LSIFKANSKKISSPLYEISAVMNHFIRSLDETKWSQGDCRGGA